MTGYPIDKIYEEAGFIAYYFHWTHDEIMSMEHRERRTWCEEISRINRNLNEDGKKQPDNPFDVFGKR
ncbi:hypothetical protein GC098_06980 [Paenibacillus sp. LMG 31458]|uniref:DUF6760 domain-containing protein n=1 Tax=Paenibacillus phytorum TaxID=2654977 RepID=A0ABX1XRK8_9BACL|nr:DUF6760 family protein [Paenibacillus phytorum]NOU71172.1 hypothetical protein [Paenibacillus phytorum]